MGYKILKAVIKPIFCFLFGIRFVGKENAEGLESFILISNHVSNLDPITVHLAVKPKVQLMAKAELFKNRFLKWLITKLGAFPVRRGENDLNAVKTALKILKDNGVLGIFPEGTRSKDFQLLPFLDGAAMIALKTKAMVVPVNISGTYKLFTRNTVYIGTPYRLSAEIPSELSKGERLTAATEYMRNSIQVLSEKQKIEH